MQGFHNRLIQSTYQQELHGIDSFTCSLDNATGGTCSSSVVLKLCPTNLLGNWCRHYTLSSAFGNVKLERSQSFRMLTFINCYFCFYPTLKRDQTLKVYLNSHSTSQL